MQNLNENSAHLHDGSRSKWSDSKSNTKSGFSTHRIDQLNQGNQDSMV